MRKRATVTNLLSTVEPSRLADAFMNAVNDMGASAARVLNEAWRRRLRGEPDPVRKPERFDFTNPPPGHYRDLAHPGYVRQGHGRLRLLADAWARWKAKRDPPGMPDSAGGEARASAWIAYERSMNKETR
jgi:hypothetical protein